MAHIYGQAIEAGNTTRWHPIAAVKVGDEYVLKFLDSSSPSTGTVEHHNGDANLLEATVTFSGTAKRVIIENMSTTATISVSFDGGTTFKTLATADNLGKILDVEASVGSIVIKASADTTPYEILAVV